MVRQLFWLVAAVVAIAAPSSHADEEIPRGRLPDDVVPQHYALTLTIDPRQTSFAGEADIEVQLKKPTQRIWLHGSGLKVKDATLRAGDQTLPLTYTEVDKVSGVARLDLPQVAAAGPGTLHLSYTADFRPDRGSLPHRRRGRLLRLHTDAADRRTARLSGL